MESKYKRLYYNSYLTIYCNYFLIPRLKLLKEVVIFGIELNLRNRFYSQSINHSYIYYNKKGKHEGYKIPVMQRLFYIHVYSSCNARIFKKYSATPALLCVLLKTNACTDRGGGGGRGGVFRPPPHGKLKLNQFTS